MFHIGLVLAFGALALAQPMVIREDHGGPLPARLQEIEVLRREARPVEIRGICFSSCTLYLGLNDVCLSPQAVIGLHGPSWKGAPLGPLAFEEWSQVFARSYKEPLRGWYLRVGRYELKRIYRFKGQQLIDWGYPSC